MTDSQWLTCDCPARMVQFLGLWVNLRKARYVTREVLAPLVPAAFDDPAGELALSVLDALNRWADGPTARPARLTRLLPARVNELIAPGAAEFPVIIAQRIGFGPPAARQLAGDRPPPPGPQSLPEDVTA